MVYLIFVSVVIPGIIPFGDVLSVTTWYRRGKGVVIQATLCGSIRKCGWASFLLHGRSRDHTTGHWP